MRPSTTPPQPAGTDDREPPAGRGDTRPAQGDRRHGVPRAPHENDESADSQPAMAPSHGAVGRAGQQDVERGVADTTKGAELDDAYGRLRRESPTDDAPPRR